MNEKDPFVIEDLDDYHLVIKADEEYRVRRELEAEVRILMYLEIYLTRNCCSWRRTHTV